MRPRPHNAFLALALLPVVARSDSHVHPHPPGPASDKAPLLEGLGVYHRAITTESLGAQRFFDQGLRLIYAFNHDEAERSFREAARLDPSCAMCEWGVALVLGPNINLPAMPDRTKRAYAASESAIAKSKKGGARPVERALIEALSHRYSDPPPEEQDRAAQATLDRAYAKAMRAVARRFPEDLDVQTLYAEALMDLRPWDLWTPEGRPQPGTQEIVATLERVLARDPEHPGANHYYIHAVEGSPHPEQATESAERVAKLMPGAGHLVHMPSHVYIRTGRYEDAAAANRLAIAADDKYVAAAHPGGFYAMYVAHNHQFLSAAAMMEGRSLEALSAAREMVKRAPIDMLRQMPGMDFVLETPVLTLVRFGRWQEVLKEPAPLTEFPLASAMYHYARGRAQAGLGHLPEARGERTMVAKIIASLPADAPAGLNRAHEFLQIAVDVLDGAIAYKSGQFQSAVASLEKAVGAADDLNYSEPPDWYYPPRHTLGAILLARGQAARAEEVYREDLRKNPDNGFALYGLRAALSAQKKPTAEVDARLKQAWSLADVKLTSSDWL